jgi:dihydroorotase
MDTVRILNPFDMHVHFRQGAMLNKVVPLTARTFRGAVVMPNTSPAITDLKQMIGYGDEVRMAARLEPDRFHPCMTLYFQTDYTKEFLANVRNMVYGIKMYPRGMTTNSDHGVDPMDEAVLPVLEGMQEHNIALLVHPETAGYCMDREARFHPAIELYAKKFPKLRMVVEHMTDRRSIDVIREYKLFATVTAHHLLVDTDAVIGDLLDPHLFCKPIPKRPEDMAALVNLVTGDDPLADSVMFGSDSAPHPINKKECAHGCAGVFTAPIALQLLADVFDRAGRLDNLQRFVSVNAQRFCAKLIELSPPKMVELVREPFVVPERYETNIVPMWAGRTIPWSVKLP